MTPHGTYTSYTNHGCRCDDCRAANRRYQASLKERLRSRDVPDHVHGTSGGYGNYGCRCLRCTDAKNSDQVHWYRKKVAKAAKVATHHA
jgi:hypothetical protein